VIIFYLKTLNATKTKTPINKKIGKPDFNNSQNVKVDSIIMNKE